MCNPAWKGRPRNDLYCVGWDVKPYSLTHSYMLKQLNVEQMLEVVFLGGTRVSHMLQPCLVICASDNFMLFIYPHYFVAFIGVCQ